MLMSTRELNGLGDLGFNLRKTLKRLNPVNVTKESIRLATHPKELVKLAVEAKKAEVRFLRERHAAHKRMLKKAWKNPIIRKVIIAAVVVVGTYFSVGTLGPWLAGLGSSLMSTSGATWIKAASVAYEIAQRRKKRGPTSRDDGPALAQANADLRSQMLLNGYSDEEAAQVIAQIAEGVAPQDALRSIGPPHPHPAPAVVSPAKQASARDKFLNWFASWKPAEAAALRESHPELFAPLVASATSAALGDGLGQDDSWASVFSSWADAAGQIVPTVLNDLTSVKTLQLQLQRARSGQPPLSTRTAQQAAVTGQMPMSFSIPLAVGGVVVLALGAVFLAPRLFGRRHHSRFM